MNRCLGRITTRTPLQHQAFNKPSEMEAFTNGSAFLGLARSQHGSIPLPSPSSFSKAWA
jgi:hypothetical protein